MRRSMSFVRIDMGWSTADAAEVAVQFSSGELVLSFVDWREQPQRVVFGETLAFRWQEFDEEGIRDDAVYEVENSGWLTRQARLQGLPPEDYVHLTLCFNGYGTLDVICRRSGRPA